MTANVLLIIPGKVAKVGVWQPQNDEIEWQELLSDREYGPKLLQATESILADNHLELKELTHIGVYPGPGSYTQVRLAVATANSLAWSLEIPSFKLLSLEPTEKELTEWLITSKRNCPIEPIYPTEIG